jgi:predicted porin
MGGGLAAFYQCESDVRFLGGTTTTSGSICDRNSAIGLRGGFGSVYFGTWDTPLKRVSGIVRITEETGWTGSQLMTLSPKTSGMARNFSNRNTGTVNYDTPNLGGFSGSLQFTALNATRDAAETSNTEGRNTSLSGQYMAGPLAVVAGYEKGEENCAVTATCAAGAGTVSDKATGWLLGASYVFGPVKVGLTYTQIEVQLGATKTERPAFNIAAEWAIGGPHSLRVGYAAADDVEVNGSKQSDTGAAQVQIRYNYAFSKRTAVYAAYVKMDNKAAGTFNLTGLTAGSTAAVTPGDDADVIAFGLSHSF